MLTYQVQKETSPGVWEVVKDNHDFPMEFISKTNANHYALLEAAHYRHAGDTYRLVDSNGNYHPIVSKYEERAKA